MLPTTVRFRIRQPAAAGEDTDGNRHVSLCGAVVATNTKADEQKLNALWVTSYNVVCATSADTLLIFTVFPAVKKRGNLLLFQLRLHFHR